MIKKILFLLLISVPCFAAYPVGPTTVSNIVLEWHCDEGSGGTITDTIISATGTLVNTGWGNTHTDFTNEITQANNADIHVHNKLGTMPLGDLPWSVGFWYKTGNGASKFALITDCIVTVAYAYIQSVSGGHWLYSGASAVTFSTACVQTNTWAHVIFSYHGGNLLRVYTNGVEAGVKLVGPGIAHWQRCVIGRGDGANSWTSSVDDIVFRNVATTAADALLWYNGDAPAGAAKRKAKRMAQVGIIE